MRFIISISLLLSSPLYLLAQQAGNGEVRSLSAKQKAQFPGGEKELEKYLCLNLRYPNKALENNITGEVIVCFMLDEQGVLSHAQVTKGLGYGCDEEALRVVNNMPEWIPAMVNNTPIKVNYILPVVFDLPKETDKKGEK